MTDKQIIIDGVDVSCCEHYTGNIGYLTDKNWTCRARIQGTKCEDWSDCYFKKWQRKEQECENNKIAHQMELDIYNQECLNLQEELKAKEQECKELNKELHKNFEEKDTLHLIIDRLLEASGYDTNTASAEDFEDVYEHMRYEQQQLNQLKAENDELKKVSCKFKDYCTCDTEKLKQTLTEIKEIANSDNHYFSDGTILRYEVVNKILQKINEVIPDEKS